MTRCPPPYRPLRGVDPPHFVDRDDPHDLGVSGIVAASIAAYAAGPCDPRFHRLVMGGPAMGKTALLRAIGREAAGRLGWAVTVHSCRAKERAIRAISTELINTLRQQWPTEGAGWASEFLALDHPDADVFGERAPAPRFDSVASSWSTLKKVLEMAGTLAHKFSRGLLVMFDDADRLAGGELESLGYLARNLSRERLPVALLFTGASQLGTRFARAGDVLDYLWPTNLGGLDDSGAREALVVPAVDRGVEFQEEALELLCQRAAGSPLELQRVGFAAWSAARGRELVTLADVHAALGMLVEGSEARAS